MDDLLSALARADDLPIWVDEETLLARLECLDRAERARIVALHHRIEGEC